MLFGRDGIKKLGQKLDKILESDKTLEQLQAERTMVEHDRDIALDALDRKITDREKALTEEAIKSDPQRQKQLKESNRSYDEVKRAKEVVLALNLMARDWIR